MKEGTESIEWMFGFFSIFVMNSLNSNVFFPSSSSHLRPHSYTFTLLERQINLRVEKIILVIGDFKIPLHRHSKEPVLRSKIKIAP